MTRKPNSLRRLRQRYQLVKYRFSRSNKLKFYIVFLALCPSLEKFLEQYIYNQHIKHIPKKNIKKLSKKTLELIYNDLMITRISMKLLCFILIILLVAKFFELGSSKMKPS